VAACAKAAVEEARAAGVEVVELQFDFDAATSKLAGYRTWLAEARKAVSPLPVTLTALPTWLDSPAFGPLARDAGYFVMQVHWLDTPKRLSDPLVLCDVNVARRAVDKAARLGVPFRVALPTYGYVAAFDDRGFYAGSAAEDAPAGWGQGKTVRVIEAAPVELVGFVNELAMDRPAELLGVIWYRLPVETDRLNWSWATMQTVLSGRVPRAGKFTGTCERIAENRYDVRITNTGEQDVETPSAVSLDWTGATYVSAEGFANFQLACHAESHAEFLGAGDWQSRLKPGESRTIARIRLSKASEIQCTIRNQGP
jgi:hypothetical protein